LAPRSRANLELVSNMKAIHAYRHTRCYGSPRMTRQLREHGFPCSKSHYVEEAKKAAGLEPGAAAADC